MIEDNLTIFDVLYPKYKINKPVRLIELFGGIGSQAKALSRLNVKFEHWKYIDFDKQAVKSYNAIFDTNFEANDITKITANDLEIIETQEYEYIITYSFPCQDLSKAGKGKGMAKGDSTRSGLLWEVERLLKECYELPQILLMENVPDIISEKFVNNFNEWQLFLESLGYKNYHQILNSKDYGIPQNRQRCFMISVLGAYCYTFPKPQKLVLKLKDMLEPIVDEKYFIKKALNIKDNSKYIQYSNSGKMHDSQSERAYFIDGISPTLPSNNNGDKSQIIFNINPSGNGINRNVYNIEKESPTLTTNKGEGYKILISEATKKGYVEACEGDSINLEQPNSQTRRGRVGKQVAQTLTTSCNQGTLNNMRIRKLTPLECWRLMGFDDEDFEKAQKVNSNTQLYKQAGNSIVVNVLESIFKELIGG